MVDKLGLNFGSSVTSARTSSNFTGNAPSNLDSTTPTCQRDFIGTALDVDAGTCADPDERRTAYSPCGTPTHVLRATRGHRTDLAATELAGRGSWGDDSACADCAYRSAQGRRNATPTAQFGGGCGGESLEWTDLAASLAGSGGLQTAATTEEEFTAADRQGGNVSSNSTGTTGSGTENGTGSAIIKCGGWWRRWWR